LSAYVGFVVREYGRLAVPGTPSPVFGQFVAPDPFAVAAVPLYREALRLCAERCFRIRITVACAGRDPGGLADVVAQALSVPPTAPPGAGHASAGAAVAVPVAAHEAAALWEDVTTMHHRWLPDTHRMGVPLPLGEYERVLAELVDVPQARAAFRLPYEIPGRPPLFATGRRTDPRPGATRPAASPVSPDPHTPTFRSGDAE
jgi:hypothetical protein